MAHDGGHFGNAPAWITPVLSACAGFAGAVLLWLGQRLIGKAAWQTALNDGFAKITAELRAELEASRTERENLRTTLEVERVATAGERASLRGEIANLTQAYEGLKALLRAHGIPIPQTRPPYTTGDPGPAMIVLAANVPPTDPT